MLTRSMQRVLLVLTLTTLPAWSAEPNAQVLFNGWGITPAGKSVVISDMPLRTKITPDGQHAVAICNGYNNPGLAVVKLSDQTLVKFHPLDHAWGGLAFSLTGETLFVSGGFGKSIHRFKKTAEGWDFEKTQSIGHQGKPLFVGGLATHPTTGKLYACNEANHEVWMINEKTFAVEAIIPVGQHPHSLAFGADQRHLYVSNWGSRGVSVIDSQRNTRLRDLPVGMRPNDMAVAPDGRLFVACSGDNTIHVITTRRLEKPGEDADSNRRLWDGTREVINTALYPSSPEGSTPDAVAVAPDGKTLFVANADNNCVMVVDISGPLNDDDAKYANKVSVVEGFIPVGWYPTSLAVSPDGNTLLVGNGKGLTTLHSNKVNEPQVPGQKAKYTHPGKLLEGSVSFIAKPDDKQMAAYTQQVRKNSPYTPQMMRQTRDKSPSIIPDRVGADCPIKYVLYIIKENRTYDQVLGDLTDAAGKPIGNGDPTITLYGEKVTPNHHQLAREYVLLDNLYCNGEVSVDGHSWCDAAMATDFNQRSWTISYSSRKEKLPGNEEMEMPTAGYLWDLCRRNGVSYMNYGEGSQRVPSENRGKWWGGKRDKDMVDFWIADLKQAEAKGVELPRFTIMSLGEDHTVGTTPGKHTPEACIASNDIGLGKIVAAASRSKFWKEMAIFVIEDDAQNGPDHVDAHRTVGFVISPWVKRGSIDSTLYTTASMIRTMELILGLPPLTQYDAGANPMFNCFTTTPTVVPYEVKQPQVDLEALNGPNAPGAKLSMLMNFDEFDLIPEDELNRILWAAAKGPDAPYPVPIHRAIFLHSLPEPK